MDNGHWQFEKQMGEKGYVGFIYLIKDTYLNMYYLGKKLYFSTTGINKGNPLPWKYYKSSSKTLELMFKERPKEEFEFICLEEYKTKGTLSYAETWSLCAVEAPTKKEWYNKRIEKISWKISEPISELHKQRLKKFYENVL